MYVPQFITPPHLLAVPVFLMTSLLANGLVTEMAGPPLAALAGVGPAGGAVAVQAAGEALAGLAVGTFPALIASIVYDI